jgi:hypothetical protein
LETGIPDLIIDEFAPQGDGTMSTDPEDLEQMAAAISVVRIESPVMGDTLAYLPSHVGDEAFTPALITCVPRVIQAYRRFERMQDESGLYDADGWLFRRFIHFAFG